MSLEMQNSFWNCSLILKLTVVVTAAWLVGTLGGFLLYANIDWYYKPEKENIQSMKNALMISGCTIATVGVLPGLGLNCLSKKIYLKDDSSNFNASDINNFENPANSKNVKGASKIFVI
ncbi:hypothetical protein [Spiroplasma endosymbiont of Nebria brevicollis]|uniref:hypothetical protein n=1 Tax=Spiroplasma endosymbiont of Nebria brevicollis TaxID=3066284 RepID=UPI00313F0E52